MTFLKLSSLQFKRLHSFKFQIFLKIGYINILKIVFKVKPIMDLSLIPVNFKGGLGWIGV